MIVPMKKVSIIMQPKDAASAVENLRSLGVLHIEHHKVPAGKDVNSIRQDVEFIEKVVGILSGEGLSKHSTPQSEAEIVDWRFSANHIIHSWKRLDQVGEYARGLKDEIAAWEPWGEFDPGTIKALGEKSVYVGLYQIPARDMKNLPSGVIIERLFSLRGVVHCAVISDREIDIPFKRLSLPKLGLSELRKRLEESKQVIEWIKEDIQRHTGYRGPFLRIKKSLEKELEFHEALSGMGGTGELMYMTGYIPYDAAEAVLTLSKKEKWGIVISDPSDEDSVPTLIRNPRWVSVISPVFKILEIIPGYREFDISLWFLIFFSVFFGMLIGDAAYGAIFFILTLIAQRRFGGRQQSKSAFILFYMLSSCAIIWGLLSGTFFGQEWLPPVVRPLIPALRDNKSLQTFCFFLGALHLSIAHLWRTVVKLPSVKALSEVGWILILWGGFFLAKLLILGDNFPIFGKWYFILGASLVVFFTNPKRNILKSVGSGLGSLLLNIVNSFTDVVSYIRLFAVGLATVAIADAFNKMAMGIGYNSVLTGLASSLILLLGHALNIVLGPLAILVHGVRLNVLEFSNHLDVKWSGFSYKPLKE